jgi:uncharacterized NAD(P)/FAD-binding protein YdhS
MKGLSHGAASAAAQTNPAASSKPPSIDPARAARVIAIVGGGFSGTSAAIHLLRQPTSPPLQVVIFEPRAELGAGVAYATRDYPYPLNLAAGEMSLDAANPGDFLDFARSQGVAAAAGDYLPRQLYGEYLRARFEKARTAAPPYLHAQHYQARVLQLRRAADGRWELWLDDGSAQRADEVVLALGNAPCSPLPQLEPIAGSVYSVEDPWSLGSCAHENIGSVLLVGSGLTMIDAALRLAAIRPRVRNIHVLSRHGLLPEPQVTESQRAIKPDLGELLGPRRSMRQLSNATRRLADSIAAAGGDWRELFSLLRPRIPALWQELRDGERARFLRHLRAYWDVHRHRVPAGPLAAVRALERLGVLQIHAGRLESLRTLDDSVEVQWRPRGATRARAWLVDRVVNCTGPDSRVARHADPLVQASIAAGWMRPDALGLGIDVDADARVIARDGTPVDSLHYIGPWLRARDWEATAVPELRMHAARLASRLAERAREISASR